jgi:hypothetical protein
MPINRQTIVKKPPASLDTSGEGGHLGQGKIRQKALGDLDRITAWVRVFAMINVAPGFDQMPRIANGFSDLILELFGPDVGMHARSAVGVALPLNVPIECEAEVEIEGRRL